MTASAVATLGALLTASGSAWAAGDTGPIAAARPWDDPGAAVKIIVGLMALMGLAYVAGERRVLEWERRVGISQVITAGLPFIVLGMIARHPSVGILTPTVLQELSPLIHIALGSVGFVAGFRFDARLFQGLPKGASTIALLSTLIPGAMVVGATLLVLLPISAEHWSSSVRDPVFVRDALILGTAGAMTARSAVRVVDAGGSEGTAARIIRLEELAGILGLALVAAFFRDGQTDGWHMPGMAWLLVTVGLGASLGLLIYAMLYRAPPGPDFLAMSLGAICLAAGAAGYLHLSSIVVAFIAGVMIVNFPGTFQARLQVMLKRLERPIYLLALFVIGALWDITDVRGWLLMPVFMVARLVGKWLAARVASQWEQFPITPEESRALSISPIGTLAIAIVVNANLLYSTGFIPLIVSSVIGGGVLTEAFVQVVGRSAGKRRESLPP